jgi:hypothetical protein
MKVGKLVNMTVTVIFHAGIASGKRKHQILVSL